MFIRITQEYLYHIAFLIVSVRFPFRSVPFSVRRFNKTQDPRSNNAIKSLRNNNLTLNDHKNPVGRFYKQMKIFSLRFNYKSLNPIFSLTMNKTKIHQYY